MKRVTESVATLHAYPLNARMRLLGPFLLAMHLVCLSLKIDEIREALGRMMVQHTLVVRLILRVK